jgi:hypothetical protein
MRVDYVELDERDKVIEQILVRVERSSGGRERRRDKDNNLLHCSRLINRLLISD